MKPKDSDEGWDWVGDIEAIEGQTIELDYGIPQPPKKKNKKIKK